MPPSSTEFRALISEGESLTAEFLSQLAPEPVLAAHLASFANTSGGALLVGISDSGDVLGLTP